MGPASLLGKAKLAKHKCATGLQGGWIGVE